MFNWQKQRITRGSEIAVCQRSYDKFSDNSTKKFLDSAIMKFITTNLIKLNAIISNAGLKKDLKVNSYSCSQTLCGINCRAITVNGSMKSANSPSICSSAHY
jgi:hypothetical protein